jgi:hypothetical protein
MRTRIVFEWIKTDRLVFSDYGELSEEYTYYLNHEMLYMTCATVFLDPNIFPEKHVLFIRTKKIPM